MAQIKVSDLPNNATVLANGDLILVTKDLGGSNYESQKMTQTDLRATLASNDSWLLTGNAGTSPVTNFIGTTDNRDVIIKRNGVERIRVFSAVDYVTIGAPSPVVASLHIKRDVSLFQTSSSLTSLSTTDELILDHNNATNPVFSINTLDNQYFKLIHRRLSNGFGATIEIGNNTSGTNEDGISFKTGSTNVNSSYTVHMIDDGKVIMTSGLPSTFDPVPANWPRLAIKTNFSGADTAAIGVKNGSGANLFYVINNGEVAMPNLPTAAGGLAAGSLWNNAGVINIV